MKRIVISQPMLFPWVGMLEQIRLADQFVCYDDVQFSKGSFVNRVQVQTEQGIRWLTVPCKALALGQLINEVQLDDSQDWRRSHLDVLRQTYAAAPFCSEMIAVVEQCYSEAAHSLADIAEHSMRALCNFFEIGEPERWQRSSALGVDGSSWERVLNVVERCEGDVYITGHGAANYLNHEAFDVAGIQVEYLDYERRPYPQVHGGFTPHVSALDLIANCGWHGRQVICSGTVGWRQFLARQIGRAA